MQYKELKKYSIFFEDDPFPFGELQQIVDNFLGVEG